MFEQLTLFHLIFSPQDLPSGADSNYTRICSNWLVDQFELKTRRVKADFSVHYYCFPVSFINIWSAC